VRTAGTCLVLILFPHNGTVTCPRLSTNCSRDRTGCVNRLDLQKNSDDLDLIEPAGQESFKKCFAFFAVIKVSSLDDQLDATTGGSQAATLSQLKDGAIQCRWLCFLLAMIPAITKFLQNLTRRWWRSSAVGKTRSKLPSWVRNNFERLHSRGLHQAIGVRF